MTDNHPIDQSILSIIIPCKNEEAYIGKLLDSIEKQNFDLSNVQIYIADANSTDNTIEVIQSYQKKGNLNIEIIEGGYPARARNNGAKRSNAKYLLFLDADIQLKEDDFIETVVNEAEESKMDSVGTLVQSINPNWKDKVIWNSLTGTMYLYPLIKPFSTGMCIFMRRDKFNELGGFDETILLGEDVELTKKISRRKFCVVRRHVLTSNRRFEKMGYVKTMGLYVKTMFSKNFRHQDNAFYFDEVKK